MEEEEVMLNVYHEDVGQMLKFDISFVTKRYVYNPLDVKVYDLTCPCLNF